jgi:DNA-binding IclR family transcriptional regulator
MLTGFDVVAPPEEKEHKSTIKVIVRMMQLFDALAARPGAIHLKDLSLTTGLHPSTAHRILNVMCEHRMVERMDAGSYRLGIRLLELGNLFKERLSVREQALPFMLELQHETGESVTLAIRRKDEVMFVERAVGTQSMMRVVHSYGSRALLHVAAAGKVFLAEEGAAAWRGYAERTRLHALTARSIDNFTALEEEMIALRKKGFATENEEQEVGVCAIAAGVRNDENKIVASIQLSAPSDRMNWEWAGLVKDTVAKASVAVGYRLKSI